MRMQCCRKPEKLLIWAAISFPQPDRPSLICLNPYQSIKQIAIVVFPIGYQFPVLMRGCSCWVTSMPCAANWRWWRDRGCRPDIRWILIICFTISSVILLMYTLVKKLTNKVELDFVCLLGWFLLIQVFVLTAVFFS